MKKFTRNFLLGERIVVRFLRKIGLGLALVLWTTLAFAQEAQDTYHLKAVSYDGCYRIDNTYKVQVTMRDFVKISKFELELTYSNTADFDFIGATNVHTALSTAVFTQPTDGKIRIVWNSATPVTILPDNSVQNVFVLNFKVAGFQHQYGLAFENVFNFNSTLVWSSVQLWNLAEECPILTSQIEGGTIAVKEKWESVVVDSEVADCSGDLVQATVTTPAHVDGMSYSFNGTDYQLNNNKTLVSAPSVNNILVIKDATCISYIAKFDVAAVKPLSWTVETPVYSLCPGGKGDIEIIADPLSGTKPYTYYLVPEEQFMSGDNVYNVYKVGSIDMSLLNKYKHTQNVFQVPAGSVEEPKYYWVAVQDAKGCAVITGTNMLSGWKRVAVIDDKTPWNVQTSELTDLVTTCWGQADGRIVFTIAGGTPWESGYNIVLNGVYLGKKFTFDSNVDVLCGTVPCNKEVLEPGKYTFVITDKNGCSYTVEYTVTQPKKIIFNVDHTDAGCGQAVGELWISSIDASTGSGPVDTWRWHYTTDPSWLTNVSEWFSVTTKVTNIPAGVYYVEMEDGNHCRQVWTNATGDDAVKILTTIFEIQYNTIACTGGSTTAVIKLVSGDANHTFQYMAEKWNCVTTGEGETATTTCSWQVLGEGWQSSATLSGITAGKYRFSVKDVTASGCIVSWEQVITEPTPLVATPLTGLIVYPSCPGNIDGNIAVTVSGGTPWPGNVYRFQIDDRPATMASSTNDFAVGAGTYTITITDSKGCSTQVAFNIPGGRDFINFQNKIKVVCAKDSVNLFNSYSGNDLANHVGLDNGYLLQYEWYPVIDHTGDGSDALKVLFWTSANGWKEVAIQGNFMDRNPKLYVSKLPWVAKTDIVTNGLMVKHDTKFGAGTYFVVAKDEWGCLSNVDTINILEPSPLSVIETHGPAECANTWTGWIQIQAVKTIQYGKFDIPVEGLQRYQYVLVQQPDIFNYPNWYGNQVTWKDFRYNNSLTNDSTLLIAVQKGTYWVAIRDYCSIHDPSQIKIVGPIVVEGLDPIVGQWAVTNPVCFGDANGKIVATATGGSAGYTFKLQKQGATTGWPKTNTTGVFEGLGDGYYDLTVTDSKGCAPFVKTGIHVIQPAQLTLQMQKVDASCFGAQDGLIRYIISGGTKPYKESTNNGLNWYDIAASTATPVVFDRRAGAGVYNVMIMDAHGCTTSSTVTVDQPAKLNISSTVVTNVTCPLTPAVSCGVTNPSNNGSIKVNFTGGWNAADAFKYYVTATKGTDVRALNADITGFVTFEGLTPGDWVIKLWENASEWYAKPYIMNPDYATAYAQGFPNTKQNSDVSVCFATVTVTVGVPVPITYDVEYHAVKCHDTNTGELHVHNVAGGTGPYFFMLQGPADYANTGVWYPATTGVMEYIFTGLPYGHYNVFIRDSKGCQICTESGEINNQTELVLTMSLLENVVCYNTATGKIKVNVTGGVPPYKYAVALASTVASYLFPLDDQTFLNSLTWQDSPEFMVKAGVWIGYVMDANGCVQGHATDRNGNVVMNHRVNVDEPTPVVGTVTSGTDFASGKVDCFGEATGKIKVVTLGGGSGPAYSAKVYGLDYTGAPVEKFYSNVTTTGSTSWLGGLKASTNKTVDIPDAEKYSVVFYDSHGCVSNIVKVAVMQPVKFEIELYVTQNAFICPDDLAGVFEIRILSGGTTPIIYRYEAWDGTTKKVDSPWGSVNTFQGPAGLLYKVWAKDANGCVAYVEKFITKPVEIKIVSIEDLSCFGDAKASAKFVVTGDPARTFQIRYQKYPETTWSAWIDMVGTGGNASLTLLNTFSYGDQTEIQGHYYFQVKDNMGCIKSSDRVTFVPVQQVLKVSVCCIQNMECTGTATISVNGGTLPYVVKIDGVVVTGFVPAGSILTYPAGTHTITVTDAHGCTANGSFIIEAQPVVRDVEFHAYKDEKAIVKDTEAKLDTALFKGTYVFKYLFNTCTRTLNVKVIDDLVRILPQDTTKRIGDGYFQVTGTVSAAIPTVGYFIQTSNSPFSGLFIADAVTIVKEGNGVKVEGYITDINSVLTLTAAKASVVNPLFAVVAHVATSPTDAKQEKWESMLVQVKGARFMGPQNPDGSWVIKTTDTNVITVNDWMYAYTPVAGHFFNVTGVINGAHDLYKLEPRKTEDVVDLFTTDVTNLDNLQFKVYPNPFSDHLNIDNSDKLTRVTITNIAGQRVIDVQYPERMIRTSNLVSGVYVVTLFTEDGIAKSERIVKR